MDRLIPVSIHLFSLDSTLKRTSPIFIQINSSLTYGKQYRYWLCTAIRWLCDSFMMYPIFPLLISHDCLCWCIISIYRSSFRVKTCEKGGSSKQLAAVEIRYYKYITPSSCTYVGTIVTSLLVTCLYRALLLRNGVTWHCWWTRSWCGGARRGWGAAPGEAVTFFLISLFIRNSIYK